MEEGGVMAQEPVLEGAVKGDFEHDFRVFGVGEGVG